MIVRNRLFIRHFGNLSFPPVVQRSRSQILKIKQFSSERCKTCMGIESETRACCSAAILIAAQEIVSVSIKGLSTEIEQIMLPIEECL